MSDVEPQPEFWLFISASNDDYFRTSTFLNRHSSFGWTSASRYIDMVIKCVCRGFGLNIPQGRVPDFARFPPTKSYFLAKTSDRCFTPFIYNELLGLEILIGRGMERFIQQVTQQTTTPSVLQAEQQQRFEEDAVIHTSTMQQMEVAREEVVESGDMNMMGRGGLGNGRPQEETVVRDEMEEESQQNVENIEQAHDSTMQAGEDETHDDHNGKTNDEMEGLQEDGENLLMQVLNTIVNDTYDDVADASLSKQQRQEVEDGDGEREKAEGSTSFKSLASTDNIIATHFDETNFDPEDNHPLSQHAPKRKRNDSNTSTRGSEQLQDDKQQDESDNPGQPPAKRVKLDVKGHSATEIEKRLNNVRNGAGDAEEEEQQNGDKRTKDTLKIKTDTGDTALNESDLYTLRRSERTKDWIARLMSSVSKQSSSTTSAIQPQSAKKQQNSTPAATSLSTATVVSHSVNAKSVSLPTPTSAASSSSKGSVTCDICNHIVNNNFDRHVQMYHMKKRYLCSASGCDYAAPVKFYISNHNKKNHSGMASFTDTWDQSDINLYNVYKKKFH